MSVCALLCAGGAARLDGTQEQPKARARLELPQTGKPAGQHNPPCSTPVTGTQASDVLLKLGAAGIDSLIGAPVASAALEKAPPGNIQWLKDRIGISNNDGPSTCATQCVVAPKNANPRFDACMTETGGDGAHCVPSAQDYNGGGDHQFGRLENFTRTTTDKATLFCATGKNWSHNRNRWFEVRAFW